MKPDKAKVKISQARLRQIVNEEIKALQTEAIDHEGVKTVTTAASKFLKACEAFKNDSNIAMANATTPEIDNIIVTLEQMISNPLSYVDKPSVEPKVVKLRQVPDDE
jgi:hypothetical protein